jgi:hypothetical protein
LKEHPDILDKKFGAGKARFLAGFSEGLIPVGMVDKSGDAWDYKWMNTNGEVFEFSFEYDIGETAVSIIPPVFKEGLAYASRYDDRAYYSNGLHIHPCFINTEGKIVIDLYAYVGGFYATFSSKGMYIELVPRFVNGYTIISEGAFVDVNLGQITKVQVRDKYEHLKISGDGNNPLDPKNLPMGVKDVYYVINTKGEIVETINGAKALTSHPLTRVALIDRFGVTFGEIYDVLMNGKKKTGSNYNENPLVEAPAQPTYGQAVVKARGYTIENNIGYLLIDVTNNGKAKDEGDLFYILYNKFKKAEGLISNTTDFLPTDYILQIHYEVGAKETKTLRVPVSTVLDYEGTEENREGGWHEPDNVADSRFILAQAESEAECAELVEFFKGAHYYGEMALDYIPRDGVTVLAAPASTTRLKNYLDQKLAVFTSQF